MVGRPREGVRYTASVSYQLTKVQRKFVEMVGQKVVSPLNRYTVCAYSISLTRAFLARGLQFENQASATSNMRSHPCQW